jgi:hypothetical protein
MKIISKINSISSLNDKNLEKFSLGNNNNRFLATKSYIDSFDFLPGGSTNFNTLDSQSLSSAKSLKFNNNSDTSSASSAVFWDFTKPGVSSLPTTSTTNLRNTVSSSNLTLNVNYSDNQTNNQQSATTIPLVLPQKFQFNQPQAQPVMKTLSSQQQQQQHQHEDMLVSRKNSLPHSSNLINNINNNNHHTNHSNSNTNSDLNVNNGVNKNNATKLSTSNNLMSSSTSALGNVAMTELHQTELGKTQNLKCPVVASPHQVMMLYLNK